MNKPTEKIERVVLKIPKLVADYFRTEFPHGQRTKFFIKCVLDYKKEQEIKQLEDKLRLAGKKRQ